MAVVSSIPASVDGVAVKDIRKYRTHSPLFNAILAENNVFGAPAGETKAVVYNNSKMKRVTLTENELNGIRA